MDRERDCTIELVNYIQSLGVIVNIGKNRAKGNKGIFQSNSKCSKIDISKAISDKEKLSILVHEFAHYIHYKYDKTLNTLNFVFPALNNEERAELIDVTVNLIPKEDAQSYFKLKDELLEQNKVYLSKLKSLNRILTLTEYYSKIEKNISKPYKYLLKYDSINYLGIVYSIKNADDLDLTCEQILYLKYKSNQRYLKRINNRINRLNKYYNQTTELWARFLESYFIQISKVREIAPLLSARFDKIVSSNQIPEISNIAKILL